MSTNVFNPADRRKYPERWPMLRGKQLFEVVDNRSEDGTEELLSVSHITGITPRSQKNVTMFKSESLVGYKRCAVGDIAANTMWTWQGAIGVSDYAGVVSPSYNVYRQREAAYNPRYLDFLLREKNLVAVYHSLSTGIRPSRLRLYPDVFLTICFPVPPADEQEKDKAKAYQSAKAEGIEMDVVYTFEEWADMWFESHKDNIMPTTQENYKYTLRTLKSFFGRRKIRDIKPFDIEMMLKKLRHDGRSLHYLAQCRGMMYQIMHKAEANDLIRKNPVRFAEKMRNREPIKRKDAFTTEQVAILMEKLPEDRMGLSIRLMLGTGMRTQEILALEPRHIEPDGSVIRIEQAINMYKGTGVVGTPKSRDSYRSIPVPESLRYCAIALRNTDKKFIWEVRKKDCPCNPTHFRDQFKKALEGIPEVPLLTPHSCRHTYVSQMQALGVDLATIQSIVGHADISMTQHYLHVQESIRQDAIERFSKAFPTGHSGSDDPPPVCKVLKFPNVG